MLHWLSVHCWHSRPIVYRTRKQRAQELAAARDAAQTPEERSEVYADASAEGLSLDETPLDHLAFSLRQLPPVPLHALSGTVREDLTLLKAMLSKASLVRRASRNAIRLIHVAMVQGHFGRIMTALEVPRSGNYRRFHNVISKHKTTSQQEMLR